MNTEELIIKLIQQDMKHQQLVEYICKAGFETELHHLDIAHIVARLMGLQDIPDRWMEVYINCLGNTVHYPVTNDSGVFRGIAQECYMLLKGYVS